MKIYTEMSFIMSIFDKIISVWQYKNRHVLIFNRRFIMTTRAEHMRWSKDRAIKILEDTGDIRGAFTSLVIDLKRHRETEQAAYDLETEFANGGLPKTKIHMRRFITRFN